MRKEKKLLQEAYVYEKEQDGLVDKIFPYPTRYDQDDYWKVEDSRDGYKKDYNELIKASLISKL